MGVHHFGDKKETQTVTQVERCFIFILCFLSFDMSGYVAEAMQNCAGGNLKAKTKALYVRMKVHGPYSPSLSLFKANMKGKKDSG